MTREATFLECFNLVVVRYNALLVGRAADYDGSNDLQTVVAHLLDLHARDTLDHAGPIGKSQYRAAVGPASTSGARKKDG
jgi:hypothetical protein